MSDPLPPSRQRAGSNAATLTALLLLAACAGGLFALVMIVAPFALGILVIGVVFVPISIMHYLVWGRLMEQHNRRNHEGKPSDDP